MPTGVYIRTPEYREKMRQAGLRRSPEVRKKISLKLLGNTHTLGLRQSPETREKIRQARLGKPKSPETREKMRQATLKMSPETRKKISQSLLGHPVSPETREKMRQARLQRHLPTRMTSIEQLLFTEFKKRRLRFEMHKTMFGRFQPDFVFEDAKLVVQADGDYWHIQPEVVSRDFNFNARAVSEGWTSMRFSEAVIKADPARCARTVARFVRKHL